MSTHPDVNHYRQARHAAVAPAGLMAGADSSGGADGAGVANGPGGDDGFGGDDGSGRDDGSCGDDGCGGNDGTGGGGTPAVPGGPGGDDGPGVNGGAPVVDDVPGGEDSSGGDGWLGVDHGGPAVSGRQGGDDGSGGGVGYGGSQGLVRGGDGVASSQLLVRSTRGKGRLNVANGVGSSVYLNEPPDGFATRHVSRRKSRTPRYVKPGSRTFSRDLTWADEPMVPHRGTRFYSGQGAASGERARYSSMDYTPRSPSSTLPDGFDPPNDDTTSQEGEKLPLPADDSASRDAVAPPADRAREEVGDLSLSPNQAASSARSRQRFRDTAPQARALAPAMPLASPATVKQEPGIAPRLAVAAGFRDTAPRARALAPGMPVGCGDAGEGVRVVKPEPSPLGGGGPSGEPLDTRSGSSQDERDYYHRPGFDAYRRPLLVRVRRSPLAGSGVPEYGPARAPLQVQNETRAPSREGAGAGTPAGAGGPSQEGVGRGASSAAGGTWRGDDGEAASTGSDGPP